MLLLGTLPRWLPHPGSCCCLKYAPSCPPSQLSRGGGAASQPACAGAELRTHLSVPAGWLEMGTADPGPRICHLLYCLSASWEACPSVADRAASVCRNTTPLPRLLPLRRGGHGAAACSEGDVSPSFISSKGAGLLCLPVQFPVSSRPWRVYLPAPVGIRAPHRTLCDPFAAEVGTMGDYRSITHTSASSMGRASLFSFFPVPAGPKLQISLIF